MKKLLYTLLLAPVFSQFYGQVIDLETIQPYVEKFELKADNKVLNQFFEKCNQSQFVVLGETHFSKNISLFTNHILPELSNRSYRHFAVEVGPHSAKILSELSEPSHETLKKLKEFNKKYYFKEDEAFPIPFFEGIEDAEFLKSASEHNYHLFGVDQEFFNAVPHLSDRLFKMTSQSNDLIDAKNKADSVIS